MQGDWVDTIAIFICIRFGTVSSISHQPERRIAESASLYFHCIHFPSESKVVHVGPQGG